MGRLSKSELVAVWRRQVESQRRSGVSVAEYCRREGIGVSTLYAWRHRLKAQTKASSAASIGRSSRRRQPRQATNNSKNADAFVQVPLVVRSAIEIRLNDGTLVSLPPDNLAALATTLKTLRAAQHEGGADD